jgi:hypothetical protein
MQSWAEQILSVSSNFPKTKQPTLLFTIVRFSCRLTRSPFPPHKLLAKKKTTTDFQGIHVFQNTRMPTNPRQPWMQINLSDKTLLSVT